MKRQLSVFLLIAICLTIFTGCWDQKIYEKIGFMIEVGIESGTKRDLKITYVMPVSISDKRNLTHTVTSEVNSIREATISSNRTFGKITLGGKAQVTIFSSELAEKGIHNIINVIFREPSNPLLSYMVVVDGSPSELITAEGKFKNTPTRGLYIYELLKANIDNSLAVDSKIYKFGIDYYSPGIDPVTALIKLNPNSVEIIGSALFSGEKMVGKIGIRETEILLAIKKELPQNPRFTFTNLSSASSGKDFARTLATSLALKKRKIEVKIKNNKPIVNISLSFDAKIEDYNFHNLNNETTKKSLEQNMSRDLKASADKFIKYTQEVGSDPIGIGDMVRAKYNSYWNHIDWHKVYKTAEINFKDDITISSTGDIK